MDEKEIIFVIKGTDVEKVAAFKEKHENCLEKHPNMTCAQYEYSFVLDGFGVLASVTCVCGESIVLDNDYSFSLKTGERNFEVIPEDKETLQIVKYLLNMKRRPGMYFGKDKSISCLRSWLAGYQMALVNTGKNMYWNEMRVDVELEYNKEIQGKGYDNEELFDAYLNALENTLQRKYRKFAEENELFT
ncbi:MAG: hypothetical protein SPK14_08045 [Lachnospiraceae bacterium]|nr:hypothetical protein [Lachnospiraceae bacterium]